MKPRVDIVCGICGRKNYPHLWRSCDIDDNNRFSYQCVSCRAWMTIGNAERFVYTTLALFVGMILSVFLWGGLLRTGILKWAVTISGGQLREVLLLIIMLLTCNFLFALLIGTLGRFHTAPGKYDIIVPTKPLLILHGILRPKLHVLCGNCGRKKYCSMFEFHAYDYNHLMLKCASCGARMIMEAPSYRVLVMLALFIGLVSLRFILPTELELLGKIPIHVQTFAIILTNMFLIWNFLCVLFFASCGRFRVIPGKEGIIVPTKPFSLLHGKLRPRLHIVCGICGRKNYPFFRKDFFTKTREIDPHANRSMFKCASCGARMILEVRVPAGIFMVSAYLITMILVWPILKPARAILGRAAMLFISLMFIAVPYFLYALLMATFCRFHAIADKDG